MMAFQVTEILLTLAACSRFHFALKDETNSSHPFSFVSDVIQMEVQLSSDCRNCNDHRRGHCQLDTQGNFLCVTDAGHISWIVKMGLGLVICYSSSASSNGHDLLHKMEEGKS
ncbi:hypothetical protein Ahy_B09g099877 [Arachis hypogaea]|uniref:Uncharacterized protein n=1 Tax=Arachis hypogaea TaxID=3818 RepID=A0A444XW36_ARAHY|nr:hypothetical protein Ahy_B09g099877 [Arachis hypogaea]